MTSQTIPAEAPLSASQLPTATASDLVATADPQALPVASPPIQAVEIQAVEIHAAEIQAGEIGAPSPSTDAIAADARLAVGVENTQTPETPDNPKAMSANASPLSAEPVVEDSKGAAVLSETPSALESQPSSPSLPVASAPAPMTVTPAASPAPATAAAAAQLPRAAPGRQNDVGSSFLERHGFATAGAIVTLGLGWLVGVNTFAPAQLDAQVEAQVNAQMVAALGALDARIVAAESVAAQASETLRIGLDATRNNTASGVAQLTTKLDRLDRDTQARLDARSKEWTTLASNLSERLARLESLASLEGLEGLEKSADLQPTGSIAPAHQAPPASVSIALPQSPLPVAQIAPASPPAAPLVATRAPAASPRPPRNGYVLREVRDGSAIVEGYDGLREVIPGDNLPGVGRVRSIERRNRQWVVVTSNGLIDASGY